jgi:hypothetical protein
MLDDRKEIIMFNRIVQLPVSHQNYPPPLHYSLNSVGTAISGPASAIEIYAPFLKKCSDSLGKLILH